MARRLARLLLYLMPLPNLLNVLPAVNARHGASNLEC
jgi:hypothetical protein